MSLQFTVLASGSSGNSSLVESDGFGMLLDAGINPRLLSSRLAAFGASWDCVQAVLLTHTHADHWNESALEHLHQRRIPLFCHATHQTLLKTCSPAFEALQAEDRVRVFEAEREITLACGLHCRPLPLRHDSNATFGFRFEDASGALAYAADLGSWDADLAQALSGVNVLALEFNHDVVLEENSGRVPELVSRILGDEGHLSNAQAAALLEEVLRRTGPGRLQHVVQLHLSRQCNRPSLALAAAREVLSDWPDVIALDTAIQYQPGPRVKVKAEMNKVSKLPPPKRRPARKLSASACQQPLFPGWERDDE